MNAIKLILLIIVLVSCSENKNEQIELQRNLIKSQNNFPIIVDTLNIYNSDGQAAPINYIGKIKSKINFKSYNEKTEFSKISHDSLWKININEERKLDIKFDLNQQLKIPRVEYQSPTLKFDTAALEAFPVCILNNNEEEFYLRTFHFLPIEIQVKINSTWMQTLSNICEDAFIGGFIDCFTPVNNCVIIEPQNMICFKLPKYNGVIKIKQRIKCGDFVSEEYEGGISEKELERLQLLLERKQKYEQRQKEEREGYLNKLKKNKN